MSVTKSVFTAFIAFSLFSACGDQKTKEVKVDTTAVDKAAIELKKEAAETEAKLKAAKEQFADSLRKIDSLKQVKEHGHAH
ncbi:MAG: hypothetical protein AB8B59_05810 [Maribacter sp.]